MREKSPCPTCERMLSKQHLPTHHKNVHVSKLSVLTPSNNTPFSLPTTNITTNSLFLNNLSPPPPPHYEVTMHHTKGRKTRCPVPGCAGEKDKHHIYRHFALLHHSFFLLITDKLPRQLPRCPLCNGYAPNIRNHQRTDMCKRETEEGRPGLMWRQEKERRKWV